MSRSGQAFHVHEQVSTWLANRCDAALFIIDGTMRVVLMNSAAQRLVVPLSWVSIVRGRLEIFSPQVEELVKSVYASHRTSARISFEHKGRSIAVRVNRICRNSDVLAITSPLIPERGSLQCDAFVRLQANFGLTNTETMVARQIFAGMTRVEIASRQNSSLNTIKTHLHHLFSKCGVQSQVGLARRIAEITAPAHSIGDMAARRVLPHSRTCEPKGKSHASL
jgi:DNA-binding CsgD family transcriptional regulator